MTFSGRFEAMSAPTDGNTGEATVANTSKSGVRLGDLSRFRIASTLARQGEGDRAGPEPPREPPSQTARSRTDLHRPDFGPQPRGEGQHRREWSACELSGYWHLPLPGDARSETGEAKSLA
jgi:hypothetical protein